ncbi:MAG: PEP-CTERM sorting domain-containing protein [bacterium]|nr:hypothetical protein [Deltaproteobacteria bacterium]MCP4906337.1 PEP-CTERM sorting domain-containing protein [bacterium]
MLHTICQRVAQFDRSPGDPHPSCAFLAYEERPTFFDFAVGDSYTLIWVGYEGCCGGSSTIRFSVDGSGFIPLNGANLDPYLALVPEPSTALLLMTGLAALAPHRPTESGTRNP